MLYFCPAESGTAGNPATVLMGGCWHMAEASRAVRARRVGFEKERGVLAIQVEAGLAFARIALAAGEGRKADVLSVLRPIAERELGVRFLRLHADSLSFAVSQEQVPTVREALADVGLPLDSTEGCAVVTVVAPDVRSIPDLMARMGEALYQRAVEVYHTADSHSSVACVIPGDRTGDAVEALRGEFGLAGE